MDAVVRCREYELIELEAKMSPYAEGQSCTPIVSSKNGQ